VLTTEQKAAEVADLLDGLLCCAESCTGGGLTQIFAAVNGSVDWLLGGLVAYRIEIKRRHLGVQAESMYSEQCVAEMAAGAARLFGADVAVTTSGVIGAEPEDGVAPGTVFVGTFVSGEVSTRTHHLSERGAAAAERTAALAVDDLLAHLRARVPTK
jgi:nicotinamide-nucleotide amidase